MMLDAAKRLFSASRRSDVPPFMVMDVVAAAARIEEAVAGSCTWRSASPRRRRRPPPSRPLAKRSAGRLAYTESLGIRPLRERIARHYRDTYNLDIAPDRIVVTTGSSAGFIFAYLAAFNPGDRVAFAVPGYPPSRHILTALGCEPVLIETGADTRYALTGEALLAEHRKSPLKGVLVASPANPTGTMMTPEALSELVRTAEDAGIRVISDEIYHGLDYAFPAETALRFSRDVIVANSFSKYFCMTGWRVGWLVVPEDLVRPIDRLQQNLAISVPTLSQIAAQAAFDGRAEMEEVKHGYERNRRILVEGLPRAGLEKFLPVDGAFYLYADVSHYTNDSFDFAKRLLEQAGVAVTPGVDFDPFEGSKFIRLCYAGSESEMHKAIGRIGGWLKARP